MQSEDYLKQLDPLIQRLNTTIMGYKYDRKGLANTIGGLQQFLETAFGLKAVQQKPFPKLPAKLFRDLSPDGPLAISARLCAEFMKEKGIKRLDWTKTEFRRELIDVVTRIRQELIRAGYIQTPRVLILPSCPQEGKLRHAISKMGGKIVPQSESTSATHILYPFPASGDPNDGQEYLRTIELRGALAHVHWWFLPDSYDEWISSLSAPGEPEPDSSPPGGRPWKVYYSWAIDSEKYNEWMNEIDYETEEGIAENKHARESGMDEAIANEKGKADGSVHGERKRSKRAAAAAAEVAPGYLKALAPGSVSRKGVSINRRYLEGGHGIDLSFGQRQASSGLPVAGAMPCGLKRKHVSYMLPAKASWFCTEEINEIERLEFPEVFQVGEADGDVLKKRYLHVRNGIIEEFKKDTGRTLGMAVAWKALNEEFSFVRKVFDFLDRWGIINYAGPGNRLRAPVDGYGMNPVGSGGLVKFDRHPPPSIGAESASHGPFASFKSNHSRKNMLTLPAISRSNKIYCAAYPDVDVTQLRYFCPKNGTSLSQKAFKEGRFPPDCSARDFILLRENDYVWSSEWSEAEVLLLLEGIESYGDDWDAISKHIGGNTATRKSPLECMSFFLQLNPEEFAFQDFMAETLFAEDSKKMCSWSDTMHKSLEKMGLRGPLPFEEAANPTMATLNLIQRFVDPAVAAEFALAAINVFVLRVDEKRAELQSKNEEWKPGGQVEQACIASAQPDAVAAGLKAAAKRAQYLLEDVEYEMNRYALQACEWEHIRIGEKLRRVIEIDTKDFKSQIKSSENKTSKLLDEYSALSEAKEKRQKTSE